MKALASMRNALRGATEIMQSDADRQTPKITPTRYRKVSPLDTPLSQLSQRLHSPWSSRFELSGWYSYGTQGVYYSPILKQAAKPTCTSSLEPALALRMPFVSVV